VKGFLSKTNSLDCSLPVLWESDNPDYPYWFGGTCFLAKYRDEFYVITAKHVIADRSPDKLLVHHRAKSRSFFPFDKIYRDKTPDPEDSDSSDWVILHVKKDLVDWCDPPVQPLDLTRGVPKVSPSGMQAASFAARGYPKCRSGIHYELQLIYWQAFWGFADYDHASTAKRCHVVMFQDLSPIESMDGMSGSPVFMVLNGDRNDQAFFAGLLIMGSKDSGLGHFISAEVITSALQWIAINDSEPDVGTILGS
jgi:hypothetical protein